MGEVVWFTVVVVSLVLISAGLLGRLNRPLGLLGDGWRRLRPKPLVSDTVSVEQLAADLRRLADLLERTYLTDQPSKMERLTAAALAYDYVLLSACRTLEVPELATLPMNSIKRLEIEAALAGRGLDW